jgi:hypothetical protein
MIARLRAFLASWRRSLLVVVGCLAYLALVRVAFYEFPQVVPWLGWGLLIIVVLEFVALGAVMYIVRAMMVRTLPPVIAKAFHEIPWADRSDKAKEKLADSLMSVSSTILGAVYIGVFVVPLTALLQAMVTRTDLGSLLSPLLKPDGLPGWQVILFIVLLLLSAIVSVSMRTEALNIYDEIAPKVPPEPHIGPDGAPAPTPVPPASADMPAA